MLFSGRFVFPLIETDTVRGELIRWRREIP